MAEPRTCRALREGSRMTLLSLFFRWLVREVDALEGRPRQPVEDQVGK